MSLPTSLHTCTTTVDYELVLYAMYGTGNTRRESALPRFCYLLLRSSLNIAVFFLSVFCFLRVVADHQSTIGTSSSLSTGTAIYNTLRIAMMLLLLLLMMTMMTRQRRKTTNDNEAVAAGVAMNDRAIFLVIVGQLLVGVILLG